MLEMFRQDESILCQLLVRQVEGIGHDIGCWRQSWGFNLHTLGSINWVLLVVGELGEEHSAWGREAGLITKWWRHGYPVHHRTELQLLYWTSWCRSCWSCQGITNGHESMRGGV